MSDNVKKYLFYISNLRPEIRSSIFDLLNDYISKIKLSLYKDEINDLLMSKWIKRKDIFFVLQLDYDSLINIEWDKITKDDFEKFLFEVKIDEIENKDQKKNIIDMINMLNRNSYFFLDIVIHDRKDRIIYTDTIAAYNSNREYLNTLYIKPDINPKDRLEREQYVKHVKETIINNYKVNGKLPKSLREAFSKYINENIQYEDRLVIPKTEKENEIVYVILQKTLKNEE